MSKDDRLTQWQEIEAATLDETVSEEEQAFRIGRRDGYSEAVQHIDMLTGGDGEYRYCLGLEDDERHCPDPDTMIARIATRLEALQAQPVGEREAATSAAYLAIYGEGMDPLEHPEGWEYATTIADAVAAALTASPPVVEREAIAREVLRMRESANNWRRPSLAQVEGPNDLKIYGGTIADDFDRWADMLEALSSNAAPSRQAIAEIIDPRAFSSVGNTHLKEAFGRGPRDREAALAKADAILALTPVEGVGEREAAFNAGWAEAVQCIENEGPMAADHMARDTTWEAYRAALSTPVAQGDDVRDALEPFADFLDHMGRGDEHDGLHVFYAPNDPRVVLKVGDFRRAKAALATLTKGARDAG